MMRALRHAVSLLVVLVSPASLAHGQTAAEAQLLYERGAEHYQKHELAAAIEDFLASNRLAPNANVVFDIAQSYALLGRAEDAYNWYQSYLGFPLTDEFRARAAQRVSALAEQVAVISAKTDPPGAQLFVDRPELGSAGPAPRLIALSPGRHTLFASLAGHEDASVEVEAVRGSISSAELRLTPHPGVLSVESSPARAELHARSMDGALGATPVSLSLPAGPIDLVLTLDGYRDKQLSATIQPDRLTALSVTLERLPDPPALLSVRGQPIGATVFLDGRIIGRVPLEQVPVAAGTRRIGVRAEHTQDWNTELDLDPRSRSTVELRNAGKVGIGQWRWLGYGGAGLLLLTSGVVGLEAISQHANVEADPNRAGRGELTRLNVTADVLAGTAIVAAVITWMLDASLGNTTLEARVVADQGRQIRTSRALGRR